MAVNLIDNEEIHVNQDGSDITLEIQADALKNENVVVGSIRTKNMCNISASGIYTNGSGTVASDNAYYDAIIDVSNYDNVYISGDFSLLESSLIRVGKYTTYPVIGATGTRTNANQNGVLNVRGINYLLLAFAPASSSISLNQIKSSFMVEEGTQATAYSPYQNLTGEENYSTGEQVIGTWINGKPLYRKTLYFASNGGGTSEVSYTLSNYGITNVDTIFITHPSFYSNTINGYRNPFQYYDGNKFSCGVNTTSLNVTLGYAPISNSPFVITLEYTKTTD